MLELGYMALFCTLTGPVYSVTTGPLCDVCDGGAYFNPETNFCESCTTSSGMEKNINPTTIVVMFFAFFLLVLIGLFFYQVLMSVTRVSAFAQNCKDEVEKQKEMVQSAEGFLGETLDSFRVNKDGSLTCRKTSSMEKTESKSSTQTQKSPLVAMVAHTKVSTVYNSTTDLTVTLTASSNLITAFSILRNLQVKLKMFTSFLQISINIGWNCSVTFPNLLERVMHAFRFVNLDVLSYTGLECKIGRVDYIDRMVIVTMGPIVLCSGLLLIYIALITTTSKVDQEHQKRAASYILPKKLDGAFKADELNTFRKVFALFDADGGGLIDKDELKDIVQEIKADDDESDFDVGLMMSEVRLDLNGDHCVSFEEFLLMMHRIRHQGRVMQFGLLANAIEAKMNRHTGSKVIYALLLLTFLVLISSSSALFHFFPCQE